MFPTEILLATDGRSEAVAAEAAAVELALGTGSVLHVVHVVHTFPELPYPRAAERELYEARLEARKLAGLRLLDGRVRSVRELGGEVAGSHYREGNADREILALADEIGAGLIVMGGRRRPWYERLFGLGLSERVSRRSRRPVLVVGGTASRGQTVTT